ncbi:MAG: hypothetical protein LKJ50_01840 [Clostridiales bacterium]|nr:hypothetical protein [Clostridiales bacterium]MCI1951511.1 hypothetical protein [Clostridiales bacterium]MCI1960640.1 hypothetical protein [Clostridiales bacterium]MCI1960686.1 hypothetical protein [Clostridiales bacterium]MCI2021127.1 hypothetical protein [Clostridiales bacterium]
MPNYDYELSEQAFIDAWDKLEHPDEISKIEDIHKFFDLLMQNTHGIFVVDHISGGNYDYVDSIYYNEPYSIIRWNNYDVYRKKYLLGELTEEEQLCWWPFGYTTYDYILCKIQKIKFFKFKNHLLIGILSYLTNIKEFEKWFHTKDYTLIRQDLSDFETDYIFWEGNPEECRKHICRVNSLPFYTNLIQPKQNCTTSGIKLLLSFTYDEVMNRLNQALHRLDFVEPDDTDSLFDIGNRTRRILEYFLKYFCVYQRIDLGITKNYQHLMLGDLKKRIKSKFPEATITQRIINISNDLSHDSGKIFTKCEINLFIKEVIQTIKDMSNMLLHSNTR